MEAPPALASERETAHDPLTPINRRSLILQFQPQVPLVPPALSVTPTAASSIRSINIRRLGLAHQLPDPLSV
jgi:hypothetical protein